MILRFADRLDAARRLAAALGRYAGQAPLVLAIPRGAVPMGAHIARALGGDLDVVLVRKLGAPGNPELAIGAVDEGGWSLVSDYAPLTGADGAYIEREKAAQLAVIRARRARLTPLRKPVDPRGRVVIVVDDGLATGATMVAALHAVRGREPARLVCAVPVASREAVERVRPYADEVVCLAVPEFFGAVGAFYDQFDAVSDDEVAALLAG